MVEKLVNDILEFMRHEMTEAEQLNWVAFGIHEDVAASTA